MDTLILILITISFIILLSGSLYIAWLNLKEIIEKK